MRKASLTVLAERANNLGVSKSIVEQLNEARRRKKVTLEELAALAKGCGLDIHFSGISRRLSGAMPLKTEEAQALAEALGIRISWTSGA